jgi:hypothetical protein
MTDVMLIFYEGRIEHWLRFGTQDRERILDRRRRVIAFAPGEIFALVRWEANDYGTVCRVSTFCARAIPVRSFLQYVA